MFNDETLEEYILMSGYDTIATIITSFSKQIKVNNVYKIWIW